MIFLYGAYGTGNLGDDAILKSALQKHGLSSCRVIAYGKPFLRQAIDHISHFDFIADPAKHLSAGDTLIFAGGGLFWAASHAQDMLRCAEGAARVGCSVRVERIGAQGVHVAVDEARQMFKLCESISVRDEFSVQLLRQLEITDRAIYEPDFVLELGDLPEKAPRQGDRIRIGLNHSAVPFFHDPQHRKKTLHIYSELTKRTEDFCDYVYIPHTRHFNVMAQNDVVYGEYFWQATQGRVQALPFPATVEDLLQYYTQVDAVMAWRYHALVIAILLGLPAAFVGALGGHKYGAIAKEHQLPQIDFDLEPRQIIASCMRFVHRIRSAKVAMGVTPS